MYKVYFSYTTGCGMHCPIDYFLVDAGSPVGAARIARATVQLWARDEQWQELEFSHTVKCASSAPLGEYQRIVAADMEQLGYH